MLKAKLSLAAAAVATLLASPLVHGWSIANWRRTDIRGRGVRIPDFRRGHPLDLKIWREDAGNSSLEHPCRRVGGGQA